MRNRILGMTIVLSLLGTAGCSAEAGGGGVASEDLDRNRDAGDAQETGARADAAPDALERPDAGDGDAGPDPFNACPLKPVTQTSDKCAPGGTGTIACSDAGGHVGFSYSCAGSLKAPLRPLGNVGACHASGHHTDFGTTFVRANCDQLVCTRYALADFDSKTAFELCPEGAPTAIACPRADVGPAAPPSGCTASGASWSTGASYGPLYCCR